MEKPQPQELVIEDISNPAIPGTLRLAWANDKAKDWALKNAEEFGQTHQPPGQNAVWLFVAPNYVATEVLAYLRHAWAEAQAPVEWPESIS